MGATRRLQHVIIDCSESALALLWLCFGCVRAAATAWSGSGSRQAAATAWSGSGRQQAEGYCLER